MTDGIVLGVCFDRRAACYANRGGSSSLTRCDELVASCVSLTLLQIGRLSRCQQGTALYSRYKRA